MHLPLSYKLRAKFELRAIQPNITTQQLVTEVSGALQEMRQLQTLKSKEDQLQLQNNGPVIGVQSNLDNQSGRVGILSYSSSVKREVLMTEAFSVQSLIINSLCGKSGLIVDRLSMLTRKLEQIDINEDSPLLKDLYQIHVVELPGAYFMHSHGLIKFACPDLEWNLPLDVDYYRAAQILEQLIDDIVHGRTESKNGAVINMSTPGLSLRLEEQAASDLEHYAGNTVMRIHAHPDCNFLKAYQASLNTPRKDYFYGNRKYNTPR